MEHRLLIMFIQHTEAHSPEQPTETTAIIDYIKLNLSSGQYTILNVGLKTGSAFQKPHPHFNYCMFPDLYFIRINSSSLLSFHFLFLSSFTLMSRKQQHSYCGLISLASVSLPAPGNKGEMLGWELGGSFIEKRRKFMKEINKNTSLPNEEERDF